MPITSTSEFLGNMRMSEGPNGKCTIKTNVFWAQKIMCNHTSEGTTLTHDYKWKKDWLDNLLNDEQPNQIWHHHIQSDKISKP